MKAQAILIGVLVGTVVILGGLLIATNLPSSPARADGGGGGATSDTIAVSAIFREGESLLYLIDTKSQVILCYGFYRQTSGKPFGQVADSCFDLVGGRSYKYDIPAVDKKGTFGQFKGVSPAAVKDVMEKSGGR